MGLEIKSYSEAREQLSRIMHDVDKNNNTVIIHNTKNKDQMVCMSLKDYNKNKETIELLEDQMDILRAEIALQEIKDNKEEVLDYDELWK